MGVIALAGLMAAYYYSYQNKALLNIHAAGVNFSGKSQVQVKEELKNIEQIHKDSKLTLVKDDKKYELGFENLGWAVDEDKMSQEILAYGHSGNLYSDIWTEFLSAFTNKNLVLDYSLNEKQVEDWLSTIDSEIGTAKKEANIQVRGGVAKVTDPQAGKTFDVLKVKGEIMDRLSLNAKGEIKLELIDSNPQITAAEAETLKDKAVELTKEAIELDGPYGTAGISANDLGNLIELKRQITKKSFLSKSELGPVYVSFSKDKIKEILDKNSDKLNVAANDAKFAVDSGKVTVFQTSTTGKTIKMDESADLVVSELEKGLNKKIILPFETTEPSVSANQVSDIEKYGIKELIGTATTDFGNSPQNRIHNIQTGIQALSGSLVKPGDEFSTIGKLGNIDAASGYLPELVIKGSETKPDFGGGLCQVSTTLFRATMNSGLKITERVNHSYRVSYYEPPVGMDATIYSPQPDFRFINNTSAYILIEGHVDGRKVTFDFYGTKDSRSVEITTPVMYDVTPPPADVYIDDPSLAPGDTKQVDHAHAGAKAYFYYRVTNGGKTDETKFVSSYVPWPAKFLRGPAADQPAPQ